MRYCGFKIPLILLLPPEGRGNIPKPKSTFKTFVSLMAVVVSITFFGSSAMAAREFESTARAPDFPAHLEWLNTDKPISLEALKGKMVLLDFWTFCCINCMHVIPDLKKLEAKYAGDLVVIGVHSAKFTNEKDTEAIRQAILRYEIEHPVVNDHNFEIWQSYGVNSWPTLVLISPNGHVIGGHAGEGAFTVFDPILQKAIPYFESRKELRHGPLKLALEKQKAPAHFLSFPGKISADEKTSRLFITDSNHHRILIADAAGHVSQVIGSAQQGVSDGSFETAGFNRPQGTFYDNGFLYIADTENHLIRRADLAKKTVETVLGTGRQAQAYNRPGKGRDVDLSSPWDVLLLNGSLYIAMAGSHQLWQADPVTWEAKPFAGSGREARIDGLRADAALAQPSGLATNGTLIFFADSETSSVRSADPTPSGRVETLAGHDLFDYGDKDGSWEKARLQHSLGVAWHDGKLYTADTYNSKIKVIDPVNKVTTTLAGTGKRGTQDGTFSTAGFNEPGGLAFLGEKLYVADTNNHQVRVLDLKTKTVSTLALEAPEKLLAEPPAAKKFRGRTVEAPPAAAAPGNIALKISVQIPEEDKFTAGAETTLKFHAENPAIARFEEETSVRDFSKDASPLTVPLTTTPGKTRLQIETVIYHCTKKTARCYFDSIRLEIPLEVKAGGPARVPLTLTAVRPQTKEKFKLF